jgi:DNA-binding SARP family transcriptional activator
MVGPVGDVPNWFSCRRAGAENRDIGGQTGGVVVTAAAIFRVLGPVEAADDRGPIPLGGSRQRLLLTALLTSPNRAVSVDRIVSAVWPDGPPRTATGQVRDRVRLLRRRLGRTAPVGADRLNTRAGGYALRVEPGELDVDVFADWARQGRELLGEGHPGEAAERLRSALELWRGQPLQGLDSTGFAEDIARWEEGRAVVQEHLIDTQLQLGRHAELVGELASLTAANPLRERFYEQWMLALYRSRRRSDALEVFRRARTVLAEELGLEPGHALQGLQQAILAGDPALDRPVAPEPVRVEAHSGAPNQLPPDVTHFAGRFDQLGQICAELTRDGAPGTAVMAITGPAGAGKTALAIRAAHALRPAFGGGQLYLELGGTASDAGPARPYDVQAAVLRVLRVGTIPAEPAERTAAYRAALAGQSSLLVLDDAVDEAQVRPLLPGLGCGVLITSRRRLTGLVDVRRTTVGALGTRLAVEILAQIAGRARVTGDPLSAQAIATACGCLPLALKVAAARLAARPGWPLAALAARLADEPGRLDELVAGDLNVRASLSASLDLLDPVARRAAVHLARLGPGPLSDAVLDELPAGVADRLIEAHILGCRDGVCENGAHAPHYRMDDLMRLVCGGSQQIPARR